MRLLLVEDDTMIGESVREGLRQDGFAVDWVKDGLAAELALNAGVYELMLLDLGLPRKEGLEVLKSLRRNKNSLPVLVLTARDAVADRVKGLNAGADDYLAKPFDLDELTARIHALHRRRSGRADPLIEHADVILNPVTREVTQGGQPLALSGREFALLRAFLDRPGAVLSRAQLEDTLYGWNEEVESNSIDVHIHSLRKKFGKEFILNVRGVGFTLSKAP